MEAEELLAAVRQRPFEPFRLVMTDGAHFDVRHPELCMPGKRTAVIGIPAKPEEALAESTVKADLFHILRIEPLPASVPPGNGSPG